MTHRNPKLLIVILISLRILTWLAIAAIVVVSILERLSNADMKIWDDAYMFVRYADHILSTGHVLWNAETNPTYGSTSLLYLPIVGGMRLIFPDNPALAAFFSSLTCGVAFLVVLVLLLELIVKVSPAVKLGQTVYVFVGILASRTSLAIHFESGMDTCFAMAYLGLVILAAVIWTRSKTTSGAGKVILLAGLTYFARPDLALYGLAIVLCMYWFSRNTSSARQTFLVFLGTAGLIMVQMISAWVYFGTPIPLSFYAKSMRLYSDTIHFFYQLTPFEQFVNFLRDSWVFFLGSIAALLFLVQRRHQEIEPVEVALFLSTTVFITYYLFFVLQIMAYSSRYYYPTYPALLFLGVKGLSKFTQTAVTRFPCYFPKSVRVVSVGMVITASLAIVVWSAIEVAPNIAGITNYRTLWSNFDIKSEYRKRWTYNWAELDHFSALPDDLSIATTEVGRVVAMNPAKTVIDLAGLNDTDLALKGFSADRFFAGHRPDLIYMPHPHYPSIRNKLLQSITFQSRYILYDSILLQSRFGVAIRKDSKYFERMKAILEERVQKLKSTKKHIRRLQKDNLERQLIKNWEIVCLGLPI